MALNNAAFGELVCESRGGSSQEQIAALGGPPRQRLSQIEWGDPVELTAGVTSQLDTAFRWGAGTSELRLTPVRRPVDFPVMLEAVARAGALGCTLDELVPLPPVLAVDEAIRMLPLAARWPGPVLIDVGGETESDRDESLQKWIERAGTIDRERLRRVGLDGPADAEPVAVDPFGDIRSSRDAATLLERIEMFSAAAADRLIETRPRRDYRDGAATVLFIAAEAARLGCDGLSVLSGLVPRSLNMDLQSAWHSFHESTGLSNLRNHIDRGVVELLSSLLALKDFHTNIVLPEDGGQPPGTVVVDEHVRVVTPASLENAVVFYDAKMCPFLPVLFDHAFAGKRLSPLVIASNRCPSLRAIAPLAIPNSHLVAESERFEGASRAVSGAALVDYVAGSAVLVHDARGDVASQRIWFADALESVSNRYARDRSSTDQVVKYFRDRRSEFGTFDTVTLVNPESRDATPTMILTDENSKKLVLHWLSLGRQGSEGAAAAATILVEAGFGTEAQMEKLTEHQHVWPVTIARPTRPHQLKLGTDLGGAEVTIDLGRGHVVVAGDAEVTTATLTAAIKTMREELPESDIVVLGATTRAPRPWAGVVGERAVGFVAPGIGARDEAAVLRSLCAELTAEMRQRLLTLNYAGMLTVSQYRAQGGVMPRLLLVIDGVDGPDEHWFKATDLIDAADMADRLDIRFLLSGTNPVPLMKWLDMRADYYDELPRFASKAALYGADPDAAVELIGEPGGQGQEGDGYLWSLETDAITPFRLDQRSDGAS